LDSNCKYATQSAPGLAEIHPTADDHVRGEFLVLSDAAGQQGVKRQHLSLDATASVRRLQLCPAAVQRVLDADQIFVLVVVVTADVSRSQRDG